ncbi:MAG: hypothetical protein QNJ31_06140 [Candidatus Caenarcaniphilales bacterium]|nr:hypothetical protein [Candidatus Caenarcaniphilales bacterium]
MPIGPLALIPPPIPARHHVVLAQKTTENKPTKPLIERLQRIPEDIKLPNGLVAQTSWKKTDFAVETSQKRTKGYNTIITSNQHVVEERKLYPVQVYINSSGESFYRAIRSSLEPPSKSKLSNLPTPISCKRNGVTNSILSHHNEVDYYGDGTKVFNIKNSLNYVMRSKKVFGMNSEGKIVKCKSQNGKSLYTGVVVFPIVKDLGNGYHNGSDLAIVSFGLSSSSLTQKQQGN